jgi:putative oxidoreductase
MSSLSQSFDLTNGLNILRIACALFFIPHLFVKFQNQEAVKPIYAKAGFNPPIAWLYASFAVETVATIGLFFAIFTPYVAILAGVFLVFAAYASWRASDGKWIWTFGGAEFPLFWAIACFAVAMQSWRM